MDFSDCKQWVKIVYLHGTLSVNDFVTNLVPSEAMQV